MTVKQVLKAVWKVTGVTQREVAEKAGLSGQGAISMFLRSKSMRVDSMLQLLDVCDYELVVRSRSGRYPEFVVDDVEVEKGKERESGVYPDERESKEEADRIREIVQEELRKAMKSETKV